MMIFISGRVERIFLMIRFPALISQSCFVLPSVFCIGSGANGIICPNTWANYGGRNHLMMVSCFLVFVFLFKTALAGYVTGRKILSAV